ncbi:MAG TPA: hypothetical protein VL175_05160, partial [Pirellulales bacterium]|nr:hypothetical protein [Pirellulales bacterium]
REGMRLSTRDMVLREPFPAVPASSIKIIDIDTAHSMDGLVRVRIHARGSMDDLLDLEIPLTAEGAHDKNYLGLLEALEPLSRGEFIEVLKKAGLTSADKPANDFSADVVEPRLRELNPWSQVAALRQLHATSDADNESVARLGCIVRAYANLGLMCEYNWNAAHKVYKARALLYAQRMIHHAPRSPEGYWHRAYALALSGLHGLALADLDAAKSLAEKANEIPPEWVDLVRDTCLYQTEPLRVAAQNSTSQRELAALLTYVTFESAPVRAMKVKLGREMLEKSPECLRIYDAMSADMEVVNLHFLTVAGPKAFAGALPSRLQNVPGVPEDVSKYVGEMQDALKVGGKQPDPRADITVFFEKHPGLWERLRAAGQAGQDSGEPSLAALGSMIEDVTFLQLSRRANFMFKIWGVPVDDFVHHAASILANHPYRATIESMASDVLRDKQKFEELVRDLDIVDAEVQEWAMMGLSPQNPSPQRVQGKKAQVLAVAHTDPTAYELEHLIGKGIEQKRHREFAHALLEASPHSPSAMGLLIQTDWEFAEPRLEGWLKEHGNHPALLGQLAWQYIQQRRTVEAKEILEKHVRFSGDLWGYRTLADLYFKEKDYVKWQATLDEYLERVEYSLEHMTVQVELADHFMERGEWNKAKPYAEEAAQSGAFAGMACAARLYEGLGEFERADTVVSQLAERYPDALTYRYYWCMRTGRGDEQASLKSAQSYLESFGERQTLDQLTALGTIGVLSGNHELTRQSFNTILRKNYSPYQALLLALDYDEEGDSPSRDKWIASLLDYVPKLNEKDKYARLGAISAARLIQVALAKGEKTALDPNEVYGTVDTIKSQREWVNFYYFVGRFDELHGHPTQARQWYEQAMRPRYIENQLHTLSVVRLRALDSAPPPAPDNPNESKSNALQLPTPPGPNTGGVSVVTVALVASACLLGLAGLLRFFRGKRGGEPPGSEGRR